MSDQINERKAEIEKLLDECEGHINELAEFQWRMKRIAEIQQETIPKLSDFMAAVKKTGQMNTLQAAVEVVQRIQRISERFNQLRSIGSSKNIA